MRRLALVKKSESLISTFRFNMDDLITRVLMRYWDFKKLSMPH